MNIFVFFAIIFLFTFIVGKLIEKIKIPWIFAALFFGLLLAIYNPFGSIVSSSEFTLFAQLGMYFLLFLIGFEVNLEKLKEQSKFIFKTAFFLILLEAVFGTLLVHFVFGYKWFISFIVALSFATVGEAILVPILDEFKIVNTKLGQSLIGIGVLDDIIEVFVLIIVTFLLASGTQVNYSGTILILVLLFTLFCLTFGLTKLRKEGKKFAFLGIENLFLFLLFILFLFLGIGEYAYATPIAALLSGVALKTFVPTERLKAVESEIKTMCYGFFAPLFFVWVGSTMNINYLISFPLFVFLVVLVSAGAKIIGSLLIGRKELGIKQSFFLGIGLSTKFSTSLIIIKILFENKLIDVGLYSIIVASSVIFIIIPVLFSNLLGKWKLVSKNNLRS